MDASMSGGGGDLKPRAIGEIMSAAMEIYKAHWQQFLIISGIVAIPVMIVTYFIQNLLIGNAVSNVSHITVTQTGNTISYTGGSVGTSFGDLILGTFIVNLLLVIVITLLTAALTRAAAGAAIGDMTTPEQSYKLALKYIGPIIIAAILIGLGVVFGLILFIIPGLFLMVKWALTIPAIVIERKGGVAAMGRSWKLTEGNFWHVAGTVLLAGIIVAIVAGIIGAIFGFLGWFGRGLGAGIGDMVTVPFSAAVTVVLYLDLRARKENLTTEGIKQELNQP